jgi:hypothetical protein
MKATAKYWTAGLLVFIAVAGFEAPRTEEREPGNLVVTGPVGLAVVAVLAVFAARDLVLAPPRSVSRPESGA